MIKIDNKKDCCGCWACANACPVKCIKMSEDEEGFLYPEINKDVCLDCGLCERVCPMLKDKSEDLSVPQSYVVQNKDTDIRLHSTSGGFYAAISDYVIKRKGVVFGVAFEEDHIVRHSYSETEEGCEKYRVSKYVQSQIGYTYSQAKDFLAQGRLVVFSGTPCQIAGLYGYLGNRKYENLITVDLVCRGTPSPRLLKKYLEHQEKKYKSKINDWKSRDKYYGYDYSTTNIKFENKELKYHKGSESDILFRLYFKNICSRPCCYQCHFRTLHRVSDITIFDCWDARSISKSFDKSGATNVFIHSTKGLAVFEDLKPYFIWSPSDIQEVVERDGIMIKHNVPENPKRVDFFNDLNTKPMSEVERKYLDCSVLKRTIAMLKPFLYRIGIFSLYMYLKNLAIDLKLIKRL